MKPVTLKSNNGWWGSQWRRGTINSIIIVAVLLGLVIPHLYLSYVVDERLETLLINPLAQGCHTKEDAAFLMKESTEFFNKHPDRTHVFGKRTDMMPDKDGCVVKIEFYHRIKERPKKAEKKKDGKNPKAFTLGFLRTDESGPSSLPPGTAMWCDPRGFRSLSTEEQYAILEEFESKYVGEREIVNYYFLEPEGARAGIFCIFYRQGIPIEEGPAPRNEHRTYLT